MGSPSFLYLWYRSFFFLQGVFSSKAAYFGLTNPAHIYVTSHGTVGDVDFKIHHEHYTKEKVWDGKSQNRVSAWDWITLQSPGTGETPVFNFVCEIPKGTAEKFEIQTSLEENGHPIMQDRKVDKKTGKTKLR